MRRRCWGLASAHSDGSWVRKCPRSSESTLDRITPSSLRSFNTMRCRRTYKTILHLSSLEKRVVLQPRLRWKNSKKNLMKRSIALRNSKYIETQQVSAVSLRQNANATTSSTMWVPSTNQNLIIEKTWMPPWKLVHPSNLVRLRWVESSNFRLYSITTLTLMGRTCGCQWRPRRW